MIHVRSGLAIAVLLVASCGGGSSGSTGDAAVGLDTTEGAADAPSADASGGCVPSAEICDGLDNDCNEAIDDLDVAGDGLYDCQTIALFGGPGANGSSNFLAWLTSNGTDVVRVQDGADGAPTLTAALLAPHEVIILDRLTRAYTADEATIMTEWIEAGGGLVVLSGYSGGASDTTYPNSLLVGTGLSLGGGLISGPVDTFVAHPVTTGVTSVTFSGGFPVASDGSVGGAKSTVVASIGTTPVGIVHRQGEGRVFVWGDEWITFDSEWTALPEIQTFWVNILGWLGRFV